jgi:hypothetical protein
MLILQQFKNSTMKKYRVILPNGKEIELMADCFVESDNGSNIYFVIDGERVHVVPNGSAIFEIFD